METLLIVLLLGVAALAAGAVLWFVLDQRYATRLAEARRGLKAEAEAGLSAARDALKAERARLEAERSALEQVQQAVAARQAAQEAVRSELAQQEAELAARDAAQARDQAALQARRAELEAAQAAAIETRLGEHLTRLAELSPEQAREQLLTTQRQAIAAEQSALLRAYEAELKAQQSEIAAEILTRAVQRTAVSHAREQMAALVELPDASWRGRVIGKEGRTVQALQSATGADFSLDEERPAVWVSSFDPWRRALAVRTLEALIASRQLNPHQAEAEARRQQASLEAELPRLGEDAAARAGVHGLAPDILTTLGRLHYRRSFGQDVLNHSVEVALLAAELARQLELSPEAIETARRGGLLHDLGKALGSGEGNDSHTSLGVDLARRCGEAEPVLHAIAAHHREVEPASHAAVLVQVADTLSAARPGARSEQLAKQVQRLDQHEKIALGFAGVTRAWVLRAGKEVRVMVDPDAVPEARIRPLAREIAEAIGARLQGAAQVKVAVVREVQASDFGRAAARPRESGAGNRESGQTKDLPAETA